MFKKQFISVLIFIITLSFIFVKPANTALETQLLVDVSPSTDYVPYTQTQWYGFTATGGKGYCAVLSPSTGNSNLYLFDTDFNRVGYSKNSGTTQDKAWYGQATSGSMHIACFGAYNPSSNFTIQVITSPYVKTITPTSGNAGILVTLTGFGFGDTQGSSFVKFGTVQATNYYSWTNTQIKVYVPSGVPAGIIQVIVYVASRPSNPTNFSFTGASSNGTMWRYDLGRTGSYPDGPTALPLSLKWYSPIGWCSNSASPVVANNLVSVPIDRYLYVFDANTGSLKWKYGALDGYTYSTPAIANGIVYVGDNSATIYAFSASDRTLKWKKELIPNSGGYVSSPAVFNGMLYFGCSGDGKIYALDANTGNIKWSYTFTLGYYGQVAIYNGVVYACSSMKLYALDAQSGSVRWIINTPDPTWGFNETVPLVNNGIAYVTGYRKIFAFNANNGALLWTYNAPVAADIGTALALDNGLLYYGDHNGNVFAIDTATRSVKWSFNPGYGGYSFTSSPVVSKGIVYFGTHENKIYALNASSGALLWSYALGQENLYGCGNGVGASLEIANGKIYVSSTGKGVYCFGQ